MATKAELERSIGDLKASMEKAVGDLKASMEKSMLSNLRWSIGAMLAGITAAATVVALLSRVL